MVVQWSSELSHEKVSERQLKRRRVNEEQEEHEGVVEEMISEVNGCLVGHQTSRQDDLGEVDCGHDSRCD